MDRRETLVRGTEQILMQMVYSSMNPIPKSSVPHIMYRLRGFVAQNVRPVSWEGVLMDSVIERLHKTFEKYEFHGEISVPEDHMKEIAESIATLLSLLVE